MDSKLNVVSNEQSVAPDLLRGVTGLAVVRNN